MSVHSWLVGVSGDWSTGVDWSRDVPNAGTADATIAAIGAYTVAIGAAESFIVRDLTLDAASATLLIDGTLNLTRRLTLSAGTLDLDGTINGGAIVAKSDGVVSVGANAVLNGVTFEGGLNLSGPSSNLTVENGLTMTGVRGSGSGSIALTGEDSTLRFVGSQTLDNASVTFGNAYGYATLNVADSASAATLTIGANTAIVGSGAYAQIDDASSDAAIVNDGAISATAKGGQFIIGGAFTNNAAVSVSNRDTLNIQSGAFTNAAGATLTAADATLEVGITGGAWTNAGTITATGARVSFNGTWANTGTIDVANSMVFLSGAFSGAALNLFTGKGNAITIAGNAAIANAGNLLSVGTGTGLGTITLNGGAIAGGTIADAGGGFVFTDATLNAVAYQGALDLGAQLSNLTVIGGLTLNGAGGMGPGTIDLTGNSSMLTFAGTQRLNNATITLGGSLNYATLAVADMGSPAALILGKTLTIVGSGLYANLIANSPDATIVNHGQISATASGGQFDLGGGALALVNYGGLSVSNGDTLTIGATSFANAVGATLTAGANSTLVIGSTDSAWVNTGTITAADATVDFNGDWTNAGTIGVTNSAVVLGGALNGAAITVAQLALFAGAGNAITLDANLANAGNVLSVGAGTAFGAIAIDGGAITGGTIADAGGGLTIQSATLTGVTYEGALDLGGALHVNQGLTVGGNGGGDGGAINLTGTESSIYASGAITLTADAGETGATIDLSGMGSSMTVNGALVMTGDDGAAGATINLAGADSALKVTGGMNLAGSGGAAGGTINLSGAYSSLKVSGGLTLAGSGGASSGTINLTGARSLLTIAGKATLDDATVNFGSGNGSATLMASSVKSVGLLTFGANLNIVALGQQDIISLQSNDIAIVNDGAISVTGTNAYLTIEGGDRSRTFGTFTNNGALTASNGGTLSVHVNDFTNLSGSTLTGGTYEADAGAGLYFEQPDYLETDDATIILNGANSVIASDNGSELIDNTLGEIGAAGVLKLLGGRNFRTGGFIDDGALVLGGGTFTASSLTVAAGGSLSGSGAVAAPIANAGLIEASGGMLTLQDAVTGAGGLQIDAGATLTLGGALAAGGTATFNGANADLAITAVSGFADTIAGLAATDEIDLLKTAATSAVVNGSNQLVVTDNGAAVATFTLTGNTAGLAFTTTSDNNGGAFIVAGATPAPHASLHLFRQYVAAGFGDHAAPLMAPQDHLAMAQPHHDFAAGR
jgi:hypothetical protein